MLNFGLYYEGFGLQTTGFNYSENAIPHFVFRKVSDTTVKVICVLQAAVEVIGIHRLDCFDLSQRAVVDHVLCVRQGWTGKIIPAFRAETGPPGIPRWDPSQYRSPWGELRKGTVINR